MTNILCRCEKAGKPICYPPEIACFTCFHKMWNEKHFLFKVTYLGTDRTTLLVFSKDGTDLEKRIQRHDPHFQHILNSLVYL